jgi:lysophospholipase L1-like esterase
LSSVFLILFFGLEIFARIYLISPKALLPWHGYHIREFSKAGVIQLSEVEDLEFELIPSLNTEFSLAPFKTNSEGLLDREYSKIKPPNTYRIVVLGDSTSAAIGVPIEKNYHSLLEEYYNEKNSSKQYEFINFAVPGYSLSEYLSVLKHKALNYNPDMILIAVLVTNDLEIHLLSDTNIQVKRARTNSYIRWWGGKLIKDSFVNLIQNFKSEKKIKNYDLEGISTIFKEFKKIGKENDIPIVIVALARYEEKEEYPYEYSILKSLSKQNDFQFIETAQKFEDFPYEKTKIFRADNHPNEKSHVLYAEAIKEQLHI